MRKDYFDLTLPEQKSLPAVIQQAKRLIEAEHAPEGYNIGMNCGKHAGQTIFHFHYLIIPRYQEDMEDPAGGVRGVIPGRMKY